MVNLDTFSFTLEWAFLMQLSEEEIQHKLLLLLVYFILFLLFTFELVLKDVTILVKLIECFLSLVFNFIFFDLLYFL